MMIALITAWFATRPASAQATFDWEWDFEQPPSETANDGIGGWFPTGRAGFDTGKGLALNGTGNAWVRASDRWNAMSRLLALNDVPGGYGCTFSVWVRTSSTLDPGYVAVRNGSDASGTGEVLGFEKLVGERVHKTRTIYASRYRDGYDVINVPFAPPSSRKVLVLIGLQGNGRDAWIQIDDAAVRCRRLPF